MNNAFAAFVAQHRHRSRSQFLQDIWVLWVLQEKRNGFFVEFGAGDGVTNSNTHLLEKEYGWNGILAEPRKTAYSNCLAQRTAMSSPYAVTNGVGVMQFRETPIGELSCLHGYENCDGLAGARVHGEIYPVLTTTLDGLLQYHHAPDYIDYISIDTEGNEFEVLQAYSFKHYIQLITVEHNGQEERRQKIHSLLTSKGYIRVPGAPEIEDWYAHKSSGA